jgi:hypothetical protein
VTPASTARREITLTGAGTDLGLEVTSLAAAIPVRDRVVTVDEPLASMLPDGGLQRGRIVGCDGPAALSLAAAMVAHAIRNGSWLALIGVPTVSVEALAEFGVPAERVIAVQAGGSPSTWAERVAVAADGFELILTQPPPGAERTERKLRQRLQARGAILLVVGTGSPRVGCDLTCSTSTPRWAGIGAGYGRLTARTVEVRIAGRRMPRPAVHTVWLPGPDGRMRAVSPMDRSVEQPAAEPVDRPTATSPILDRVG